MQAAKSLTTDLVAAGVLLVDDPAALLPLLQGSAGGSSGGGAGLSSGASSGMYPRLPSMEALGGELQAVLFAQQAILFAPRTVQPAKHVPMLQVKVIGFLDLIASANLGVHLFSQRQWRAVEFNSKAGSDQPMLVCAAIYMVKDHPKHQ
jgi:hypothetical protein